MSDAWIAGLLFTLYAINDQWGFRCQRVVRGILLLAKDSAAAHPGLFSNMVPGRYVASIWLGRVVLITAAVFGWRAFGWLGPAGILAYAFVLGAWVDGISPWPSYRRLLGLVRQRLETGAAGVEGFLLLPTVQHIDSELKKGIHFEAATTDVWILRGVEMARDLAPDRSGPPASRLTNVRSVPMSQKQAIRNLAQSVGGALEAYIAVHNRIFEQAATLKSLFKNLLGRGVAMSTLLMEAESLVPRLAAIRADVERFRASAESTLDSDERAYLDLLSSYAGALESTVTALVSRQRLLAAGSKGGANNPMTWDAFQAAERQYQQSIERYKMVGAKLNDAAPLVFD